MKEFVTAIADAQAEDAKDKLVPVLDADDQPMRNEDGTPMMDEPHVRFTVDGRLMRAYYPHEGQLTFLLASFGRGISKDARMASTINVVLESLREDDAVYLEGRLLTRDPEKRLSMSTLSGVFEHLMEEWFARPTQRQSDSADLPPTAGDNSTLPTTPSPAALSGHVLPDSSD